MVAKLKHRINGGGKFISKKDIETRIIVGETIFSCDDSQILLRKKNGCEKSAKMKA